MNGMAILKLTPSCKDYLWGAAACAPISASRATLNRWPKPGCSPATRTAPSYLPDGTPMTYGDVFLENEREFSAYNFEVANVEMMRQKFDDYEAECHSCLERKLPLPAYDCVMKCSHAFNLLDARGALSAVERANYILRVRAVAKACCEAYMAEVAGVNENADQEGEVA